MCEQTDHPQPQTPRETSGLSNTRYTRVPVPAIAFRVGRGHITAATALERLGTRRVHPETAITH